MNVLINDNLNSLNTALNRYAELTGKSPEDILLKQGGKLGYALRVRLREAMPAKGSIRAERLEALKRGEGVRVGPHIERSVAAKYQARTNLDTRKTVFGRSKAGKTSVTRGGKRLNLRALMVQRELSARESGRGFLSISARYPRILQRQQVARSRIGPELSKAGINANADTMTFSWTGGNELAESAATGLSKAKGEKAIAQAIKDVELDILEYVKRKDSENARKAGLR